LVTNLLRNAATFSSLGGKIVVCSKAADGHAVVRVRDNGFGIPTDRVNTVFEMFSQIPEHRERTGGGGLGIGLALSRQLVELHGGSIEATSRGLGHGSEFVVRLPMSEEKVVATDERQDAPEQLRRVLVVDDNTDACDTLGMVLELQGHTVQVAYDGPTALRSFESFRPDAVLLDLGLPRMHGYELARRIRALPGGESVLLVAITGWGQESDRQLSREAGIDEHLVKPVSSEQLSLLMS
jgi:CheY-like chemotaxis protein